MVELLIIGTNFPSLYMYFRTIFERQDFRLPLQCSWSQGCWRHIVWQFVTDVSGQPTGPTLKDQWDCLTTEDWNSRLSWNNCYKPPTYIP